MVIPWLLIAIGQRRPWKLVAASEAALASFPLLDS